MTKSGKGAEAIPSLTLWSLLRSRMHLLLFAVLLIGINRAAGLAWPYLSKYLVDDVIVRRSRSMLLALVVAGVLATLVQGLTAYVITRTISLSALHLLGDLRKRIHRHVSRLPLAYYDADKAGALVSRVMSDVEGVRSVLGGGFVAFLGAVATACIAFAILIRIDVFLTLVIFMVLLPFGLIARNRLRKYRPLFREANAIRAEVTGRLTESFNGVRVVKAYRAESHEQEVFASGVDQLLNKVLVSTRASAFLDLTVVVLTGAVGAAVMYFGGVAIMMGKMTVGDFLRYVMFLSVLVAPVIQAVSIGTQFNEAFAGLERVQELLAQPREGDDPRRSVRLARLRGEVCFRSVSFAYKENAPVLRDVSFRAEPGTTTALVGPSGAGKSTLTALIAGFYEASDGAILVDGVDLALADLDAYRAHLGIVPQDPFLFSGTIRDNVAFSRPEADEEEIIRACHLAHVDEFASRFADGYQTRVGERGIKLSMGQRQRVALARAILANPRILILD